MKYIAIMNVPIEVTVNSVAVDEYEVQEHLVTRLKKDGYGGETLAILLVAPGDNEDE